MSALNEFAFNLPISTVPALATQCAEPAIDATASVAVPPDISPEHKHITVNLDSTQLVCYNAEEPCVTFDMVLNVSICDPQLNNTRYFKMVKRLVMDKVKLALQAETMVPVQVIEAETEESKAKKLAEESAAAAATRAKQLAGLL